MTTRIPAKEITGLYGALVKMFSKRMFGRVPESLGVMWHHVPVLKASMGFGQKLQKWDQCDESLKSFAHMAVASYVGCSCAWTSTTSWRNNEGLDVDRGAGDPAVARVRCLHAAGAGGARVCRGDEPDAADGDR